MGRPYAAPHWNYCVRADLGCLIWSGLNLTGLGVKGTGNDGNKVSSRGTGGLVEGVGPNGAPLTRSAAYA